jgi:hypothetical protein
VSIKIFFIKIPREFIFLKEFNNEKGEFTIENKYFFLYLTLKYLKKNKSNY